MLRTLLLLLMLLPYLQLFSQQQSFDNYQPLTSSGNIPPDLLQFYVSSREFDPARVTGEQGKKFREQNTGLLAHLFASGKVLFNDQLSIYAQKVLDTLLTRNKELKGKLRVYTLRSAEANAFTSHDGKIFITTGFLANLENEAQLAYVLAHESVHYRNNHVFRDFVQRENAAPGSLAGLRYSREHEGEADIEGLRILLNSDYSTENIDWVLDVLFYSYLPVDNVALDKTFFETPNFAIPDSCILKEQGMDEIGNEDENYMDVFQTHPSISNRKKEIKQFLEFQKKDTLRKQFLFPEEEFYLVRNIARFELSYLYYLDHKLEESIYNSYVMLQEFPGNAYLQKMLAGSLYALCTYKKDSASFFKVHTPYKKLEGYQRQFAYLFEKLDSKGLCDMAWEYSWKVFGEHRNNEEIQELTNMTGQASGHIDLRNDEKRNVRRLLVMPDITVTAGIAGQGRMYEVFSEQVNVICNERNIEIQTLDPFTLLKNDVTAYNELVLINDWMSNRLKDGNHHRFIMTGAMGKLIKKYGNYISFVSITVNKNSFLKRVFGKRYSIAYLAMMLDLETGELVHTGSSYARTNSPFVEKKRLSDVLFKK